MGQDEEQASIHPAVAVRLKKISLDMTNESINL
jgi:hypothetical protein